MIPRVNVDECFTRWLAGLIKAAIPYIGNIQMEVLQINRLSSFFLIAPSPVQKHSKHQPQRPQIIKLIGRQRFMSLVCTAKGETIRNYLQIGNHSQSPQIVDNLSFSKISCFNFI